jgi:drug/metabolite transporter (DMT)-like permease
VALILGFLILNERVSWYALVAMAVVLVAVVIMSTGRHK